MARILLGHNPETMSIHSLRKLAAFAALLQASPGFAVGCDALRAEVESKIRNAGVAQFSVSIVEAGASEPGRMVGTCDQGKRKLLYVQARSSDATTTPPAAPSAAARRPAKKVEPILTECKDGSVSMNSDCKK